jgi:hypothetical protein
MEETCMPAADFPSLRTVKPLRPKPEAPVSIPISPLQIDLEHLLLRLEQLPEAEQAWEIDRWSEQQRQHFPDLLPAWRTLLAAHLDQQTSVEVDPDDTEMDDELYALLYPDQPDPALIAALYSQLSSLDFGEDHSDD